jgi:hypothetical protein
VKALQEIERLRTQLQERQLDPEEPLFVLRAQDILSATTVEQWAEMLEDLEGEGCPKVGEARRLAAAMRRWPKRKVPGRNFDGGQKK